MIGEGEKTPPNSSGKVTETSRNPTDPFYKGPARTEEDYKTSFKNIIERCSHTEDTNRVNYLAGALDRVINFKINRAVKNNPAIDASKNAEEIAETVLRACMLAPSHENIKELSPIIKERITVLKEKQESMVQKRLLSRLKSLEKLPVAPGLPKAPTHEIRVEPKDTTTDPTSRKGRVVQNAFNALKEMHAENEKEYNFRLDKLYETFSEHLSNKTDAKTVELIGKEYDRMINEQDPKKK